MSLYGKVAIVTGGSRGIGRAICLELAAQGANVMFSYAGNDAAAQETLAALKELGVEARCFKGDVTDAQADEAYEALRAKISDNVEINLINGGQPVYYYIVSVE